MLKNKNKLGCTVWGNITRPLLFSNRPSYKTSRSQLLHYQGKQYHSINDGSISLKTVHLTIPSRCEGGSMRRRLLFLIHVCCPAASPINQSGSRGQTGNESVHCLSAAWLCVVCVGGGRGSERRRRSSDGVLTWDGDKVNVYLKVEVWSH